MIYNIPQQYQCMIPVPLGMGTERSVQEHTVTNVAKLLIMLYL